MPNPTPFSGAKIALLHMDRVLVYLRDDKPTIPYPGTWDLPGGGAEGDETPLECALRELFEEFGMRLDPARVCWSHVYPGVIDGQLPTHFFVARIGAREVATIVFGDEGQEWTLMPVEEFLSHPKGVDHLQARLRDYFDARG